MPDSPTPHSIRIGNVEIVALPDGAANLNVHPAFAAQGEPPIDWNPIRERNPDGFHGDHDHWRIHNTCYLVRSQGRTLVADLGVGVGPYPRYGDMTGALPEAMRTADLDWQDVDTVFFTHAHPDHVAWSIDEDTNLPRFPRARYLLHQRDWDNFGGRTPPPRYFERFVRPLQHHAVLDLLPGETAITSEVTAIETPGHTPGHMSLLITSDGERALITGDALTHPVYITEPWREFGSDADIPEGIATRKSLVDRLEADNITLAAGHFPEPGFGHVVSLEGKRWFRAL